MHKKSAADFRFFDNTHKSRFVLALLADYWRPARASGLLGGGHVAIFAKRPKFLFLNVAISF
jgi:hypothetical protein